MNPHSPTLDVTCQQKEQREALILTGKAKIMLMDDEDALRDSIALILQKFGFTVETVTNGEAAIEKYKLVHETEHPYDVVVLDLNIKAGLGGHEALLRLKEINPQIKAIAMGRVGHDDPVMAHYRYYGFCGKVIKPFTIDRLIREIKRLIDVSDFKNSS